MVDKNIEDPKDPEKGGMASAPASEAHIQPQSIAEDRFGPKHRAGDDENPMDKEFKEGKASDDAMGGGETALSKGAGFFGNKKSDIKRAFR